MAGGILLAPILALYQDAPALSILAADGARLSAGQAVARLHGSARAILSAERTLLNFLGHMSGVATLTAQYVDAIADVRSTTRGTAPVIVDTRKTTPGFRVLDKYAVRCGGGGYHRMGLYDGVMLKDNHLAALRETLGAGMRLGKLTKRMRGELDPTITLWLEVDTLEQLKEELSGGEADIVLLDNFSPGQMREAVGLRNAARKDGKPLFEASGGITLENVREVAATGIDRIAIGALTHSAKVLDLAMDFE
ncbi:MAG: carboxylating nicotinate-nucleotide diphosphorylase [Phycisphaerae bacterium]